jgi:CcmD family protein
MMKKLILLIALVFNVIAAFAQSNNGVEMADRMRSQGKIYVVIVTIVIVFIGLAIYLFSIDRRLKKIERND